MKKQPEIRDPFLRVGTIRSSIAKAAGIPSADIYISRNFNTHMKNRHKTEYQQVGLDAITYAQTICRNFNQIRETGKADDKVKVAVLLIVHKERMHDVAVVELNYSHKYHFWEIKTAEPRRDSSVKKLALKWEGAKHPTNGNG
ncbi:MAG: hypothetical protein IKN11_07670 [Bacteroidales bacterium]|nr:hypothetical protein [Bacteroidales bacterium]